MKILRMIIAYVAVASLIQGSAYAVGVTTIPGKVTSHNLPDFVKLAEDLTPAVVNISTKKNMKSLNMQQMPQQGPNGNDPFEDFFGRFFRGVPERHQRQNGLGSGVLISEDGEIITNNHVVADADEIMVKLSDHHEYKAKILGTDDKLDIAVLKIDPKGKLHFASLGDSDEMHVGEWVMAIGNPFGLERTVTAGIISAKGRVIGSGPYDDFLQTDASINPGNSGGPLINGKGEVIGINTAIIASGQGIGFAIPINMAKSILPQLREGKKVTRGYLGVNAQLVTADLAKSFGLEEAEGALVSEVFKGSPAEKSGVKVGDIILAFDGKPVHEVSELPRLVAGTKIGKSVHIILLREGKKLDKTVTVGKLKGGPDDSTQIKTSQNLGISVQDMTKEYAENQNIPFEKGAVVTSVESGSLVESAGLMKNDIIREINGHAIANASDYEKVTAALKKGSVVRFLLKRGDGSIFIGFTLG
ncbi:MAG: DegQ family serine endoprotease [Desulfuromonadaceae bacterium]|nr:DegQ family serine endoprotease [Desulfuromonadaceae bacterium]